MSPPPTPLVLDHDCDPWDQQPGETDLWFTRFRDYLALGRGRTLRKVAETLRLHIGHIWTYGAAHRWTERATAWDAEQQRQHLATIAEYDTDAAIEQIKYGRRFLEVAASVVENAVNRHELIPISVAIRLAETGAKLVAAARTPTSAVPETPVDETDPFAGMTDAQRGRAALEMAEQIIRANEVKNYREAN